MRPKKLGLLLYVGIAIVSGICCGYIMPDWFIRIAITFNKLFSNFLSFFIPLLILGFVASGIADIGREGGRMLLITFILAYFFTIFGAFGSFITSSWFLPKFLDASNSAAVALPETALTPYFILEMPPSLNVIGALIIALILGIGCNYTGATRIKNLLNEFRNIIQKVIQKVIIPCLPIFVFGLFATMTNNGTVFQILKTFGGVAIFFIILCSLLLCTQYGIAGILSKRNPWSLFKKILPAMATAFGTQSSAATIPVTLECVKNMKINEDVADFVVPTCGTIQLAGAIVKLVAEVVAIAILFNMDISLQNFITFIFMLSITAVAAPGIPGGVAMAAIGLMSSILGFNDGMVALMLAVSVALEGISTATSVSGDGAVAVIVDSIEKKYRKRREATQ